MGLIKPKQRVIEQCWDTNILSEWRNKNERNTRKNDESSMVDIRNCRFNMGIHNVYMVVVLK